MKRLHVHVRVSDLDRSIDFYRTLFDRDPDVRHADYAKWMLDDPLVNFALSQGRGEGAGVAHLGIQVGSREELAEVTARLAAAGRPLLEQAATTCCYARGDKTWAADPQGVSWETFFTFGDATEYGEDPRPPREPAQAPRAASAGPGCGCGG